MSVAASEVGPEPAGGGTGASPGTRPRESCAYRHPARARRMDRRPRPRLRPLAEVLREIGDPAEPGEHGPAGDGPVGVGGPAWDAALDAATAQVGPLAIGLLTATAEVLDGRRPLAHLGGLCPPPVIERVRACLARARPGFPRGARVRGLRLCAVVGTPGPDGAPGLAVEVAAALCGDGGQRARATAARFELDATRTWRVTELTVL
jgi:hypothetical protein